MLGKRRDDVFRDDPIATKWVRAMIGAMYGHGPSADQVGKVLGGIRPQGMSQQEYEIRLDLMARSIPDKTEAHALLKAYVSEAIAELEEHLEQVEALAERDRALDAKSAGVDRTADGARLTQYAQAQDRTLHAALRRLEALQNPRRPRRAKASSSAAGTAAQDGGAAGPAVTTQASGLCHQSEGDAGATEPASEPRQSVQSGVPAAENREKLAVEPILEAVPDPQAPIPDPQKLAVEPILEAVPEPQAPTPEPQKLAVEPIWRRPSRPPGTRHDPIPRPMTRPCPPCCGSLSGSDRAARRSATMACRSRRLVILGRCRGRGIRVGEAVGRG
jgi:hypothetical protein